MMFIKKNPSFLLVPFVILCIISLADVCAEDANPKVLGWGIAFGAMIFPQPTLDYRATSIGDIKFPCRTYGGSLSVLHLRRETIAKRRRLLQIEAGVCWLSESGHKDLILQGYPAKAESQLGLVGIGASLKWCYLQKGNIWLSSGLEIYCGWSRDDFNITLQRNNRELNVFDPKTQTDFGAGGGLILLSIALINNTWDSWNLQFGYGGMDSGRENVYGEYENLNAWVITGVTGWYLHIRKIIPLKLRKDLLTKR